MLRCVLALALYPLFAGAALVAPISRLIDALGGSGALLALDGWPPSRVTPGQSIVIWAFAAVCAIVLFLHYWLLWGGRVGPVAVAAAVLAPALVCAELGSVTLACATHVVVVAAISLALLVCRRRLGGSADGPRA